MGYQTPKVLLNSVFFYNGKKFCLRSVQEHHSLCFSQLHRATDPDRYIYREFGSKNLCGGVNDASEGEIVSIVATSACNYHVGLLDFYFSKVPPSLVQSDAIFYRMPLPFLLFGTRQGFFDDPLPYRPIQSLVKKMCEEANIPGNFTNHSLRETGTTIPFDAV